MKQDETTVLTIEVDKHIAVQVKVPTTMSAIEFGGFVAKMNFMKTITKQNMMSTNTIARKYHVWTPAEKEFLRKNPKMSVAEIKTKLKLENVGEASIYSARKKVLAR